VMVAKSKEPEGDFLSEKATSKFVRKLPYFLFLSFINATKDIFG